jgi:CheY-like chemotaxis protein
VNAEHNPLPYDRARTVLVVEDEVLIRMVIADALRSSGLCVVEAGSAGEAMAHVRSGAVVDLIFTDVEMPGPMDGTELVRQLHVAFPGLAIMLTSGSLPAPDAASIDRFIAKPYDPDQVAARICALLTEPARD